MEPGVGRVQDGDWKVEKLEHEGKGQDGLRGCEPVLSKHVTKAPLVSSGL